MIETNNAVPGEIFRTVQELNTDNEREELGQTEFLELMTAQLENQDPFKPLENGDFLAQIAQFSTVSGIGDLQKSFDKLSTSLVSNQALQAANLVGHKVLAPTGTVGLTQGGSVKGSIELPAASSQVTINVLDRSGQTIRELCPGDDVYHGGPHNGRGTCRRENRTERRRPRGAAVRMVEPAAFLGRSEKFAVQPLPGGHRREQPHGECMGRGIRPGQTLHGS